MTEKKPFEIARETLKQITTRKLVPTPVNYQSIYNEIAGLPNVQPFPDEQLRRIAQSLPARNPGQEKQRSLIEYSIGQRSWQGVQNALMAYMGFAGTAGSEGNGPASPVAGTGSSVSAPALTPEFFDQIARFIENVKPALGEQDPRFLEQMQSVVQALRDPVADAFRVKAALVEFSHRVSFAAEDQAEIRLTLLKLLQLIIENIGELATDDSWLRGQTEALREAAQPPLTLRRLDDVERRLKDVIFKQSEAKDRAQEAQEELRQMLAAFIARLSQVTESSGSYQGKMEESVKLLEGARRVEDIAPVLKDLIEATRTMAQESSSVRDELRSMRERAETTENELVKLHRELDRVSVQARHDALTGALNRQGLDEALNREISTVRRKDSALSVALLDIDNFKKLNDSKGHETGDAALTHLATVARECMRPQDTLARYGGEEFVILLPDTPLDKGIEAMTRLQRELSKRFFLADAEKVLITFSAGVAQLESGESGADAIRRADQAMYLAKRAGKNRVLGA